MSKDYQKFIAEHGNSFCALPFTEICNTAQGHGQLCCFSDTIDQDMYNKDIMNTWKENKVLKNVRHKMLNNEPIKECRRCYQYEKDGAYSLSKRLNQSIEIENKFPGTIQKIKEQGKLTLRTLDLKFGNKCNLACIMCDGHSSSLHTKEKQKYPVPNELKELIVSTGEDNDFDRNNLQELLEQAPNLLRLKFTGGEPTLLDGFKEFIQKLSETPYAKNIEVIIVTNGTTDVTKWIPTFSKFKLVEINWSTDGIGSTFEYIRYPGKWEKTKQIQQNFNETIKQYSNIKSTLTSAIQLLNIDQLPELLQYGKEYNFTKFSPVLVMWPEALNIGIVPNDIKEQVIKECEQYIELYPQVKSFINIIEKSSSKLTWNDTKRFLTYYDHVRNYSAKEMCPIYDKIDSTLQGA